MSLNIVGSRGNKNDPAFRYKMSPIIGKVEGRGNGIKTVIVNCVEIAAQLHRPTEQLCKFFGCELAAQSKWDATNEKAIVNGSHTTRDLQDLVDLYCDKFVLCPSCNLPETQLKVKSSRGEIWHVCAACGEKTMVDMTHKLCTFILKQAKSKKLKKKERNLKKEKDKEKKRRKETQEEREIPKAVVDGSTEISNVDEHGITWSTDFSDEAVKMRKLAEMSKHHQRNTDDIKEDEEEDDTEEKTYDLIVSEAAERIAQGIAEGKTVANIKDMAINLQVAGGLSATDRILIFYNAVMLKCRTAKDFSEAVETHAEIFHALVKTLSTGPEGLLRALESHFSLEKFATLSAAVSVVLQAFYDEDLLSEEEILKWYERPVPTAKLTKRDAPKLVALNGLALVKEKAKPFVEWMKTAESDESEEED
eukprot:GSMAST32.ASY1.ANO1.234.1 assembled CDS